MLDLVRNVFQTLGYEHVIYVKMSVLLRVDGNLGGNIVGLCIVVRCNKHH